MKVLVAYGSRTGNTRKIAEAIYDGIQGDKELKKIGEVPSLDGYDLTFLGFPTEMSGPSAKDAATIAALTPGKKVALFTTHFAPEGVPEAAGYVAKFCEAAAGAQVLGTFDCRGKASWITRTIMSISKDPEMRLHAKDHTGDAQPDGDALERARAFARQIMAANGG